MEVKKMALQMKLETLDELSEEIAKLYVEKDGVYILDVQGHEKPDTKDKNMIPKGRLDAEISKRREAEKELADIAEELKADVPEEFKDMVPDLPAGKLIPWLRNSFAKGLFEEPKSKESIDSKRPGDQKPTDFKDMNPTQIMATGYNKTK
jgi:hypothetical protein